MLEAWLARHDLADTAGAGRDLDVGDLGAVLALADRGASTARLEFRGGVDALALVAKDPVDGAALEAGSAKVLLGRDALGSLLVLGDCVVLTLLGSRARTVARSRGRWGRGSIGPAALNIRVPGLARRALWRRRGRVLGDTAALATVPVIARRARRIRGRERR